MLLIDVVVVVVDIDYFECAEAVEIVEMRTDVVIVGVPGVSVVDDVIVGVPGVSVVDDVIVDVPGLVAVVIF